MSEVEKKEGSTITLLNRGQRHFDFGFEAGADGKPDPKKPRKYGPNGTITLPAKEGAAMAAMYPKELIDISKLPGAVDVGALKAEKAKLAAENEALKAQLAALPKVSAATDPLATDGDGKGKKK